MKTDAEKIQFLKLAEEMAKKKSIQHNKSLLIVESPAKARTISKYLGKDYTVQASIGHIKDLPPNRLGVKIDKGFEPEYRLDRSKKEVVEKICASAQQAAKIFIGTDPDREGEAIAYHIAEEIKKRDPSAESRIQRVLFTEITKSGIQKGLEQPRSIDMNLVLSQQARRVLDRLIGYKISPFLWKMFPGQSDTYLSAGRVQSVALRLVVERERAIEQFEPIPYWVISGVFHPADYPEDRFEAQLTKIDGKTLQKPKGSKKDLSQKEFTELFFIRSESEAKAILKELQTIDTFTITDISSKSLRRKPPAPFITSTLQQEASIRLGIPPKRTMRIAQQLYEGVSLGEEGLVGLITYMRTDSPRISPEAQEEAREYIAQQWGKEYLPAKPPEYASKVPKAQEAHEAIRPTSLRYTPDYVRQFLDKQSAALYELIYNRFLASQMKPAEIERTTVIISGGRFEFRATGSIVTFPGFLIVYQDSDEAKQNKEEENAQDQKLPESLSKQRELLPVEFKERAAETKPPARYTEASLIKELEEKGIGRPSTYATIVSTIQDRGYVTVENRKLFATELGKKVVDTLIEHFPDLFEVSFTAKMETHLDSIAEGQAAYRTVVEQFYFPMENLLQEAERKNVYPTISCPECGAPMTIRQGRYGPFWGCTRYPDCNGTLPIVQNSSTAEPDESIRCPECNAPMVLRNSKRGRFYGCSRYPECTGTRPYSLGIACPVCGKGEIVERQSKRRKIFYSCSRYPDCNFIAWRQPVAEKCPNCGNPWMEILTGKGAKTSLICPSCSHKVSTQQPENSENERESEKEDLGN